MLPAQSRRSVSPHQAGCLTQEPLGLKRRTIPLARDSRGGIGALRSPAPNFIPNLVRRANRRFRFDGIQAVWFTAENVVQIYDQNGLLLKSVGVGTVEQDEAA